MRPVTRLTPSVVAETLSKSSMSSTAESILPISKNTNPCAVGVSQQQLVCEETTNNAAVLLEQRHDFSRPATVIGEQKPKLIAFAWCCVQVLSTEFD